MDSVCVYLSSYNGEEYIEEQLTSILQQEEVSVHLIIRDDGSKDNTIGIINKIMQANDNVELHESPNIGCEKSFHELLSYAHASDYYAFSDQDDIWNKRKLITSIRAIEKINGPALASTNLMACDSKMKPLHLVHSPEAIKQLNIQKQFNYLINMHGCVLLWNKELQNIINEYKPNYAYAHDVWVCAIANSVGTMRIVDEPLIQYRLHGNNVSGLALNRIQRIKKGIRIYLGKNHPQREKIAQDLLKGFSKYMDTSMEGYRNLILLANYKNSIHSKVSFIMSNFFNGVSRQDALFWRICILFNKY